MQTARSTEELCALFASMYGIPNDPRRPQFAKDLHATYIAGGYSMGELSNAVGISSGRISALFKAFGLKAQKTSFRSSTAGPCKRSYGIAKPDYFSVIDSDNKAYALGWIWADGNLTGKKSIETDLRLRVSRQDMQQLVWFKNQIGTESPVNNTLVAKKYNMAELMIYCQELGKDLRRHGIIANRALNDNPPPRIPKRHQNAFWRGCIDGDGWIQRRSGCVKPLSGWELGLCGNLTTVTRFREFIRRKTGIEMRLNFNGRSKVCFKALVTGPDALDLMRLIYGGGGYALARKLACVRPLITEYERLIHSGGESRRDTRGRRYLVYPK